MIFSFSGSESEGLNENWIENNLFSMRSHMIDFCVCIKPNRMVVCVPLFEKRWYNPCIMMWAPCRKIMQREVRGKGRKGDKQEQTGLADQNTASLRRARNIVLERKPIRVKTSPTSVSGPLPLRSFIHSVSINCLPQIRHRATYWSHEDKESLSSEPCLVRQKTERCAESWGSTRKSPESDLGG